MLLCCVEYNIHMPTIMQQFNKQDVNFEKGTIFALVR